VTLPPSDLLDRYRNADQDAGEALLRAYIPVVRSLALAGTLDPDGAAEVAQRALTHLKSRLGGVDGTKELMAAAEEVTRDEVKEWTQAREGRPAHLIGLSPEAAALATPPRVDLEEVFGALPDRQSSWMLLEAVDFLPDHYKALFLLRHMEGLERKEIGELAGLSEKETATGVNAARRLFHRELAFNLQKLAES